MSKLDEIAKKLDEVEEMMKKLGKEALQEAFTEFFQKHPEARAIVWSQYTPYFNDGEPCEFRVNDAELKVDYTQMLPDVLKALGVDPEEEEESEEDDLAYCHGDSCASYALRLVSDDESNWHEKYRAEKGITRRNLTDSEQSLSDDFEHLVSQLTKLDDLLQVVIGDHVLVTVTPDAIETSDYDHA